MPKRTRTGQFSPLIVAIAGWLLPGAGYWIIGQRTRGTVIGMSVLLLFVLGLFISGIRVIDVPGYDAGLQIRVNHLGQRLGRDDRGWETGSWAMLRWRGALSEIADKPWFVPQAITGPIALVSAALSVSAAEQGVPRVHARLADIGTLYTAVAGMLNLMAIVDAAHRASHPERYQEPVAD